MGAARRHARNRRGEGHRLRRELIDAADRLLQQGATHQTLSLRAVAREVGIATTSVYLHFADVTELLIALYVERFADLAGCLDEAIASTDDPAGQLRAACLAYERFSLEHANTYRVLFEVPGTRQDPPPGVPRQELPGFDMFNALRGCLDRCVAAGLARPMDTFAGTVCLVAALHGLVTLRASRPSFPWPPIEELVDHLLSGQAGIGSPAR